MNEEMFSNGTEQRNEVRPEQSVAEQRGGRRGRGGG